MAYVGEERSVFLLLFTRNFVVSVRRSFLCQRLRDCTVALLGILNNYFGRVALSSLWLRLLQLAVAHPGPLLFPLR